MKEVESAARVLIVDDDQDQLEILARWVRREGFLVDVAKNGRVALSMADRHEHPVLLTDLHMPGMDGLELARRIRACETETRREPTFLVAITGSNFLHGETLADCFDEILLKPVRLQVLTRLLAPFKRPYAARQTPIDETQLDATSIRLVPDYLSRRREDLRVLRRFLSGDTSIETVVTIGHRMRGTALTYGFPELGKLGAALEGAARTNQSDRIAELIDTLERKLASAC